MESSDTENLLREVQRTLRAVEPAAFVVPARILRRVIIHEATLSGLGFHVPHRKSFVISSDRLLSIVDRDELGETDVAGLPPYILLLAYPDARDSEKWGLAELQRYYWRLLFHTRVHRALDERREAGKLDLAGIHRRIDRIGQVEFDEIQAVLAQEHLLFPGVNRTAVYVEFAAVFLELRYFSPQWLPTYFPSLSDIERVEEVLSEDIDARELFHATCPAGFDQRNQAEGKDVEFAGSTAGQSPRRKPSVRAFRKLIDKADRAASRGNNVRAAILKIRAASYSSEDAVISAVDGARREINRLVMRLQAALELSDSDLHAWSQTLEAVLLRSSSEFWNANARLLYDLQKVCLDHEREQYVVDLWYWLRTWGRGSIKRLLPGQRTILISKHLRSASRRVSVVKVSAGERLRLTALLRTAAKLAEAQLRVELRPAIVNTLDEVGLVPRNVPEEVARHKMIEELLDGIADKGFFTMGNLRDAIARNDLKLDDLSSAAEFWQGDRLLKANHRLGQQLDGVYYPGEFYLRVLQSISSLAFGTPWGRLFTKYLAVPYGGAFVALEGLQHMLREIQKHLLHVPVAAAEAATVATDAGAPVVETVTATTGAIASGSVAPAVSPGINLIDPWIVFVLGTLVLGIMHSPLLREGARYSIRGMYRFGKFLLFDLPLWLLQLKLLRTLLRSWPIEMFRRHLLQPLLVTLLLCGVLPALGLYAQPSAWWTLATFAGLYALLNSRLVRNMEELSAEWMERTWYAIRVRVVSALFELIMDTFKRVLEGLERLLYAVDEWLRFRSGESTATLALKAALGFVWGIVTFFIRFCVTLLIEPQLNPIKHFPVVTVSHKIILPMQPVIAPLFEATLGKVWANTLATAIVTLLPGMFGFLVWELKENWRSFAANRQPKLRPASVGSHGESFLRLLKPGLHSGTIPKLYARLRRAQRHDSMEKAQPLLTKQYAKLHHIEEAIARFIDRELCGLLHRINAWKELPVKVGHIEIACNNLRIELLCPRAGESSVWIAFQEQSGWLLASVLSAGWLMKVRPEQQETFSLALCGLYKRVGVDLVREQIERAFDPHAYPYDVNQFGLTLWTDDTYRVEIYYPLRDRPMVKPLPRGLARKLKFPKIPAWQIVFAMSEVNWNQWVELWTLETNGSKPMPAWTVEQQKLVPTLSRVALLEPARIFVEPEPA